MIRRSFVLAALVCASPAIAGDVAPGPAYVEPPPVYKDAPPVAAAKPRPEPKFDLSRSVQMTGSEIQSLMKAAAAQATAQAAVEAAASANDKLQRSLQVPEAEAPKADK